MSKRVNVTLPDLYYDELVKRAQQEGRTPANLAAYLLGQSLRELQSRGDVQQV